MVQLTHWNPPDFSKIPRRNNTPASAIQVSDWAEMVKLEPRLQVLFDESAATRDDKRKRGFCANAHWYGYGSRKGFGIKPRLTKLVGWYSEHPSLRSMKAYSVAYKHIYEALPGCRNCACW